jgi:hypothetical protein
VAKEKEGGPVHGPNTCVWKAGRWECLHGVDADHFWYGDVLVDLNQLRHEELRMGRDRVHYTDWQVHEIGVSMSTLRNYAQRLAKGEQLESWRMMYPLKRINQLGLHTGVVFKD